MGSRVWLKTFPSAEPRIEDVVRNVLCQRFEVSGDTDAHYGVAVLTRIGPDSVAELTELTRRSQALVLLAPGTHAPLEAKWELLAAGASDVMECPCAAEAELGSSILARLHRWSQIDAIADDRRVRRSLVGESRAWRKLVRQVIEVAQFSHSNVLLLGQTGTGKEHIAGLVHELDVRQGKADFVIVDCTTLSPELSGSELFGHERGAFTGAIGARDGAFALANKGTLFLDEIGELPLQLQAQLLRVIQEHSFKRVGSNMWQRSEFRLICATNRDLPKSVAAGAFRADLYYRIADAVLETPPLAERRVDIIPLANHFLACAASGRPTPELDETVREFLIARDYPGNVRDLRRIVLSLYARHAGPGPITIGAVPASERPSPSSDCDPWSEPGFLLAIQRAISRGVGLKEIGRAATGAAIRVVLDQEDHNIQRAARRLKVTDRALQLRRAGANGQQP